MLGVEIDGKNAISLERKALREVCGSCRLSGSTLEVHDANDLAMLSLATPWKILSRPLRVSFQVFPEDLKVLC